MLDDNNSKRPLSLRGRVFVGTVVAKRMSKTITVEWGRRRIIPKYERYEKRRTRIHAHLPDGSEEVNEGDVVVIMESRPISKTKNFVFVRKLSKEEGDKALKEQSEQIAATEKEEEKEETKESKPEKTEEK